MSTRRLGGIDARFSLANERTYLPWTRTALVSVGAGAAAAKGLHFHREVFRWVVAAPPILAVAVISAYAPRRWRIRQATLESGGPTPAGGGS